MGLKQRLKKNKIRGGGGAAFYSATAFILRANVYFIYTFLDHFLRHNIELCSSYNFCLYFSLLVLSLCVCVGCFVGGRGGGGGCLGGGGIRNVSVICTLQLKFPNAALFCVFASNFTQPLSLLPLFPTSPNPSLSFPSSQLHPTPLSPSPLPNFTQPLSLLPLFPTSPNPSLSFPSSQLHPTPLSPSPLPNFTQPLSLLPLFPTSPNPSLSFPSSQLHPTPLSPSPLPSLTYSGV